MVFRLLFIFIFSGFVKLSVAQSPVVTEITNNLAELFSNDNDSYGDISLKSIDNYLEQKTNIYFFDIFYNNKVIYREGIKKSIPQTTDASIFSSVVRFKFNDIYLDASQISDQDKLKVLESQNSSMADIAGKKVLIIPDFEIISFDSAKNKYVVNNVSDKITSKVYRLVIQ